VKYHESKVYILFLALLCYPASFSSAQTADDLFKSRLMQQQNTRISQPDVDVPSYSREEGVIRPSDLLPEEIELFYPEQSPILLDGKIDPAQYIVGPGDLLGIYLWGEIERSYRIRVTPEGYLIIPTVGSIMIADLSIADVREQLKNAINKNYKGLDVSVFLIEPRRFRLYISGLVYLPGMHISNAFERVSDLMDGAGLIVPGRESVQDNISQEIHISTPPGAEVSVSASPGEAEKETPGITVPKRPGIIGRTQPSLLGSTDRTVTSPRMEPMNLFTLGEKRGSSSRSIIIHRKDTKIIADMLRFIKLGDLDANPYVNSGDHIEVPPYNGDITVVGEVNDQGIYEFKQGDRICDLIGFGGGLTSVADTSNAELTRFEPDGRSFNKIAINLYDALYKNPDAPEYVLQESDRFSVRKKYEYKVLYDVTIDGEIKYPGQYAIEKNVTTLTDLVKMAGGFTGNENLEEARLIRKASFAVRDLEYERLKDLLVTERTLEENDYVRSYQRTFEGSINIDFVKLFRENDLTNDVVLQDGDAIYIPIKREYVNVMGAVKEPGYIKVNEDEDFDYYIEKAGGYNWDADKKERTLVKARTGQRYKVRYIKVKVEGGDTIHVPEKERRTFWSYFREFTGYATSVATVVLIAVELSR